MKDMILDFGPGLHGHFLEYIINKYIYCVDLNEIDIFDDCGASHNPLRDKSINKRYKQQSFVELGHFSEQDNREYPKGINKVVFINYNHDYNFIYLVNFMHRVPMTLPGYNPDVKQTKEQVLNDHLSFINSVDNADLRNNLFTKIYNDINGPSRCRIPKSTYSFIFDYGAFFTFPKFLTELQRLALVLKHKLHACESLDNLYINFIKKNQGYQYWRITHNIINCIMKKENIKIVNNVFIHAYLNYFLSEMFCIYDGPLFSSNSYPKTTNELITYIPNYEITAR